MKRYALIFGDLLTLAIVTLIGFASHAEFSLPFIPRMAAAFLPLSIAWFLLAPSFGLFTDTVTTIPAQLWRPAFVMVFAGSFAAILRGLVIDAPVPPTFAIVLGGTAALALTLWRLLWLLFNRQAGHR